MIDGINVDGKDIGARLPNSIVAQHNLSNAELFLADALEECDLLKLFEEFIYGDSKGYLGKSRLNRLVSVE